tara:strand:+ start:967 stop:1269 length:303 start_codon:yes stop_codon:yes gene_type:complete
LLVIVFELDKKLIKPNSRSTLNQTAPRPPKKRISIFQKQIKNLNFTQNHSRKIYRNLKKSGYKTTFITQNWLFNAQNLPKEHICSILRFTKYKPIQISYV